MGVNVWKTWTVQLRDIMTPITAAIASIGTTCLDAGAALRSVAPLAVTLRILHSRYAPVATPGITSQPVPCRPNQLKRPMPMSGPIATPTVPAVT